MDVKRNGKYYLTYAAAGTEYRTYAMGCAVSSSPLGPFVPQKNNPILRSVSGLITGTAHGCIVEGPNDSIFAFYTIRAGHAHGFERRIGMDRAEIDGAGELRIIGPTSSPQWLARQKTDERPWVPLNVNAATLASSSAANVSTRLAVDEDIRTWWQPAADDKAPMLTATLRSRCRINAARIIWRDIGLDANRGITPGPFGYRVEARAKDGRWQTIIDRTTSEEDLLIDYRECGAVETTAVRLVITRWPTGITPGVAEFTVFGEVLAD